MLARESRVQPPALDSYSDMPLFNTKAVVRQTGAPAPTLRAWERRYGVLAPRRGENGYRLYSERDIAIVAWLRERVESGLTISQAIALLRSLDSGRKRRRGRSLTSPITHEPLEGPSSLDVVASAPPVASASPVDQTPTVMEPVRSSLAAMSQALARQFGDLDEAAVSRTIAQAFAIYPVEDVLLALFEPTLIQIGQLWSDGEATVTVEHFASAIVRGQLEALFRATPANPTGPLVLVGCAPGELHELGPLMLAILLRRAGFRVVYLGQSVELEGLISAVQAERPACVLLSATLRPQAETLAGVGQRLEALGAARPDFFFGGQAFSCAPDLAGRIPGVYLGVDTRQVPDEIKRRTSA